MRKLTLTILALVMGTATMLAVPAKRGVKKVLTLADGTRVEATLKGDEHVHYYQSNDGRAIQRVGDAFQFVSLDSLTGLHTQRMAARNKARASRPRKAEYRGKRKGLVILVEFTDVKFTYDKATFKDYFNKAGYTDYGMHGSVHDYFYEQSYKQFDLEFDVVGPVTANSTAYYYSTNNTRVASLVNTLCQKVDDEVDFSQYDWDGDGTVDQVYVIYAGYGAAQGADGTIWPHEWTVRAGGSAYKTGEGVTIDTYGISCELRGSSGNAIDGIGTACHEFSHCLGLPDFYDTSDNGSNFGMGPWSLMDYGCYSDNGRCPSGYTAYERWVSGWLEPTVLESSRQVTEIPAIEDEPVAYVVYNDNHKDEYYLLANHQQKGFDTEAGGHGMLVLHVDYSAAAWTGNTVNQTASRQRMTLIPADNVLSYSTLASDPWPGTRRKTALTDETTPAATLYNANIDGRKLMGKPIENIMEVNGLVTFDFMGGLEIEAPVVAEATNITDTSFRANWQAYPGAKEYTVELTQTVASDNPWDFLIFRENFANFESEVASSTDMSAKLDDYTTLPGWTGENLYVSPNKLRVGNAANTGWIETPEFEQPTQNALSMIITPLSASPRKTGSLKLRFIATELESEGNYAEASITNVPIVGSEDAGTTWLYRINDWEYGKCKFGVYSEGSGIYLDYLAAFDGNYEWDDFPSSSSAPGLQGNRPNMQGKVKVIDIDASQLNWVGGKAPQPVKRPRKAKKVTSSYYTTTNTYYDFTSLEPATYSYRVRVATSDGYSPWSEEATVDVSTSVQTVKSVSTQDGDGHTYMLDGRRTGNRVLRPGIYVRNGRKVVVR